MGEGGCFGELALLRNEPRAATVVALTTSQTLTLSRDQFNKILGGLGQASCYDTGWGCQCATVLLGAGRPASSQAAANGEL